MEKLMDVITKFLVTIVIIGMLSLFGYIWYTVSDHSGAENRTHDTIKGR